MMLRAIELARQAGSRGEIPVGAVIVKDGKIIAEGYNRREEKKNALSHAETEAINTACEVLGDWRLDGCVLYVTLEPCPMCTGAIINSRIRRLVFGASDYKAGSCGSVVNLFDLPYNHKPELVTGFMQEECSALLTEFFANLRQRKKQSEKVNEF